MAVDQLGDLIVDDSVLNPSQNMAFTGANGPWKLSGANRKITVNGTATITITSVISEDTPNVRKLIKAGANRLTLSGNNTFSGGLDHTAGILGLGNNGCLGTGPLTISSSVTMCNNQSGANTKTLANPVNLAGDVLFNENVIANPAEVIFNTGAWQIQGGNRTIQIQTTAGTHTVTINSIIGQDASGRGLSKTGNGTLTLGAANTYTGPTTVNAGTLNVQKDGGLGGGNVSVASGATLKLNLGTLNNYIDDSKNLLLSGAAATMVNLAFTGSDTINALSFDGGVTFKASGTWGAVGSGAAHEDSRFIGTGLLNVTTGPGTTTALTSSVNPSVSGQSVTFTATVTGATPTGTVTFKDGAATLGTGTLNGSGVATFSTSTLSVGSHPITAVYGGDANNNGSTSSTVTQVVNNNTAPVAVDDNISRRGGTNGTKVLISELLANDTDVDNQTLTLTAFDTTTVSNATITSTGGFLVYTTTSAINGTDSFNYTVSDGFGGSDVGTVTVTISDNPGQSNNLLPSTGTPGTGDYTIHFMGIRGRAYHIQVASATTGPWTTLQPAAVADAETGMGSYNDPEPRGTAFYRTVYP